MKVIQQVSMVRFFTIDKICLTNVQQPIFPRRTKQFRFFLSFRNSQNFSNSFVYLFTSFLIRPSIIITRLNVVSFWKFSASHFLIPKNVKKNVNATSKTGKIYSENYSPYFKLSLPILTICRIVDNFWNSPLEIAKV